MLNIHTALCYLFYHNTLFGNMEQFSFKIIYFLILTETAQKGLTEFFARRQKKIVLIVFSGGMYVGENTSHGASVELFAFGEQPRRRAQCSPFVKEACFFDKLSFLLKLFVF